ncbi:type I restriction endonuclease subunit S [Pseudomonas fluvialis]|uniref:Type I restriction endonuclease EcoAI subunit S n=1 Tax=Pseudomonas fluvialis TaxID=1793966 RepID=A0ABQ2ADL2_9PSED|nr:restriction endonuclease subunit S [Pseudomonas fluvialis]OXM40563.1 type I restriction endonuclease subunit S [Pseudomonas fluvialis]GGH89178.1 type I restriction endonuclease EcoAI subunit S [Pseudomonas fluvialis]
MTALLTDNLPLLAGAPNGIKKLRELILELAVRGKLVSQDPSDEPASELLKRIAEEKARLVVAGKKGKQQAEINDKEQPFSVPQSWSWVRLGSCLEMINGRAFKPTEWIAAGLPIVRIQNLNKPDAPFNYCDPDTVDDRHVIDTGTILISWSGTPGTSFGAFIWERGKAALNQHIFSCFQVGDAFFDKFLKLAINTRLEELIAKAHGGVGLQHVTKGKLEALTLVLPPLAEQHRIVAKVDELMALCDRLEAQQADAESAHAQLVQALLDSLTQASDAEDFAQSWQRLAEHFHTLFTTESSIDALKQTLLQLAVMGKLVPQDSNDEPADELVGKIAKEIAQLHSEGKIRKPKPVSPVSTEEAGFESPQGWRWLRLSQITRQLGDGLHGTPIYSQDGAYHFVNGNNLKDGKIVIKPETKTVSESEYSKHKKPLDEQSILVSINGTIGNVAFYNSEKVVLGKSACYFNLAGGISKHFVRLLIEAPGFMEYALKSATGTTIKNLGLKAMNDYPIALPPLAEQHRIVAKVDQLMALCDQLKTRLTQARQLNEQLASTLVEQAVA